MFPGVRVSRCPSTLLCELTASYRGAGKGEGITLIVELTSGEGLTAPVRSLPFLLHASNDVEVVHQERSVFYHGLIGRRESGTGVGGQIKRVVWVR